MFDRPVAIEASGNADLNLADASTPSGLVGSVNVSAAKYFKYQWGMRAIKAPTAWANNIDGKGESSEICRLLVET